MGEFELPKRALVLGSGRNKIYKMQIKTGASSLGKMEDRSSYVMYQTAECIFQGDIKH